MELASERLAGSARGNWGAIGFAFLQWLKCPSPLPLGASAVIGQVASRLPVIGIVMQKTVEYTNNRLSPATVELLIRERSKGKSLRQLGQMFNRSHEKIRQILTKYGLPQVTLLSENSVAAKLGYQVQWLTKLRKQGIINPIKPSGRWLYSEEQVRQIAALIAEARKCEECGNPRPLGFVRFCRECGQYRKKHRYRYLSLEAKARHTERCLAWQKANPEKGKEIQSRTRRKY